MSKRTTASKKAQSKPAKKSSGNSLKNTIKNATPKVSTTINYDLVKIGELPALNTKSQFYPLQYKGSFIKEDKTNADYLRLLYGMTYYPEATFETFIGQFIYAISENDFVGLIEVVDKTHAKKLCALQSNRYTFAPVLKISELADRIAETPKETEELPLYEIRHKAQQIRFKLLQGAIYSVQDQKDSEVIGDTIVILDGLIKDALKVMDGHIDTLQNSEVSKSVGNNILKEIEALPTYEQLRAEAMNFRDNLKDTINKYLEASVGDTYEDNTDQLIYSLYSNIISSDDEVDSYEQAFEYKLLLENLIAFFLVPENCQALLSSAKWVGMKKRFPSMLKALYDFFTDLMQDRHCAAVDRVKIEYCFSNYLHAKYMKQQYEKLLSIAEHKKNYGNS